MIDFHVCGTNHKTTNLILRERLTLASEKQAEFLTQFKLATGADEAGVLMTCNRSEWFWSGSSPAIVQAWLANYFALEQSEFCAATYLHSRHDAVRHFMVVAAGLDSMMLGEPQIFGQIKTAFLQMQQAGSVGEVTQTVFPVIFAAAKKVRTQTAIAARPTSIAYAAVNLARCIFTDFSPLTLLLVGAGETTELVAKHFTKLGIKHLIAANRTLENAQQLAATYAGEAITLDQLSTHLPRADIIVSATASPIPLIKQNDIAAAMRQRRRPLYLIDLAMPRDIEASVGEIDGVYLYNLDALQSMVAEAREDRDIELKRANDIIQRELQLFTARMRTREITPDICDYRNRMQQLRDNEVQKALQQLKNGLPADEVLTRFAMTLTNKIMHEPTVMLKALSVVDELA